MTELCVSQELNLDGNCRREETPESRIVESKTQVLKVRIAELKKLLDYPSVNSSRDSEALEELMRLSYCIEYDDLEAMRIQEFVYARRFKILAEKYDVNRIVRKANSIIRCESDEERLTPDGIKRFSAICEGCTTRISPISIVIGGYYNSLLRYFIETKKIGLGLPDKVAMRIKRTLYSLQVCLKQMNIEIERSL